MTLGEFERAIKAKQRVSKAQAQEKAASDYILADLIGRSVSRIYNKSNKLPDIYEVYPHLFDNELIQEQKRKQQENIFAIKLKQYSNFHNNKMRG